MPTDRELLRQYVKDGSEAAFAELVRRYVRLVYSVALRQAASEKHLAEDITQTVFIILARKAHRLTGHETLVGWLHTTTRHTALCALRDQRRRQAREHEAFAMETNPPTPVPWEQIRPLLDEVVGQLNETDRQAVLLRYFQGRSHREVGEALGQTEDAARVRVNRALEKLRQNFARQGILATGVLLSETILANAAEAEPSDLAGRVNKNTALATKAAATGLSGLLLHTIFMTTKNKLLIVAVLILLALLLTLLVPKWGGASMPTNFFAFSISKASTATSKNRQSAVQLPQAAAVPASSSNVVSTVAASTSTDAPSQPLPKVAPRPPEPGGVITGLAAEEYSRNLYHDFFQKLNLTPAQQDAFMKILGTTPGATAYQSATKHLSEDQILELTKNAANQMDMQNDPSLRDPWALSQAINNKILDELGITAQVQTAKDAKDAQLQQLLGSDGLQYYQTYTSQQGVREWVINGYGNTLQSAGLPELSADQQEALVGIIAKSLQPGDPFMQLGHLQEVVDQASAILSPEQIEALEAVPPRYFGLSYARLHQTP